MGVNFIRAFVLLISIVYINAQEYAMLGNSDLDRWDIYDQSHIFFDQNDHVINRREAPETDLEGSGNGDVEPAVLPEEPQINKTSSNPENEKPPADVSPVEEKQEPESVGIQISNFGEIGAAQDAPKSNETKTEPEEPIASNKDIQNEAEPPSNATKPETNENEEPPAPNALPNLREPKDALPVEEVIEKVANGTATAGEKADEAVQEANENDTPTKNTVVVEEEPQKAVDDAISAAEEPNVAENATNEAPEKSEVAQQEPDIVILAVNAPEESDGVNNQPENPANGTVSPTQKPDVGKDESETVANQTDTLTEKPNDVAKELPPLIHNVSNKSVVQKEEKTVVPVKIDNPAVPNKEEANVNNTLNSENKEKEEAKVPPQVLPSDLAEDKSTDNKKESELVNEQQSGSAVLFKVSNTDKASQVEGSDGDKALKGLQESAKISNEPTEQPTTGESAKNVSRAGKDTTILVVLFVVVIAIGGAAFTHNYIKKRKQNASAQNDLVNGIRRSLQNLSSTNGKNNTDVEQGTELKPLMKDTSPAKDYSDSKKEVQA